MNLSHERSEVVGLSSGSSSDESKESHSDADAPRITRVQFISRGAGAAAALAIGSGLASGVAEAASRGRSSVLGQGGRLRFALGGSGAGATQNLFLTQTAADRERDNLIYEPLGATTFDGSDVVGVLAASAKSNATATVWTIHLHKHARFSDGTPLTAADVVYTYHLAINTPAIFAAQSLPAALMSARITALDAHTVQFRFKSPTPEALAQVIYLGTPFIIRNRDTKYANGTVGTGPFVLRSSNLGQSALLAKNPHYWGAGASHLPYLQGVEILAVSDATARITALRGGSVDYVADIPLNIAKVNKGSSKVELHIANATGSLFSAFFINTRIKPFDDPRVRLALKLACNRKQLSENVTDGFATVANDILSTGYVDNPKIPQRAYDPAKAKQLLQEVGASGLNVVITSLSDFQGSTEAATVYAQQLQAVGINATVKPVLVAQFFGNIETYKATAMISCLPVADRDWGASASIYMLPGSRDFTGWASPSWIQRFQKARSTVNVKQRRALDATLQKETWSDGPIIAWGLVPLINASSPRVAGIRDRGFPYSLYPNLTAAQFTK